MKAILLLLYSIGGTLLAADPSLNPVLDPAGSGKFAERWRIRADLDGDGQEDMLLSGPVSEFGKSGGEWMVYVARRGEFQNLGTLTAHPRALSIEPDHARNHNSNEERAFCRIWVYLQGSADEGAFGYYRIGAKSIKRVIDLELYPGDGGTDLGRAVYAAVFEKSPIPYRLEHSETDKAGKIQWKQQEP